MRDAVFPVDKFGRQALANLEIERPVTGTRRKILTGSGAKQYNAYAGAALAIGPRLSPRGGLG